MKDSHFRTGLGATRPLWRGHLGVVRLGLLLVACGACSQEPARVGGEAARADVDAARRMADELAERLTATLMQRMTAALEGDGVIAAARVCSEVAQSVTREVGAAHGATVRRTALRLRNPLNRPDDFERAWLEKQEERVAAGQPAVPEYHVELIAGSPELRHLRPIVFPGGVCVSCHGADAELAPEIRAFLAERYPDDQAVGFKPGDLRGAISIRVPVPPRAGP